MRKLQHIIIITATILCAVYCHRKDLEELVAGVAYIPITTDWSSSLVDTDEMTNISIHIFPYGGSTPTVVVSDNHTFNVVKLPVGRYSILIINEMLGDLDNLEFRNEESFADISTNIIRNTSTTPTFHIVADNEHLTRHHDHLAAWHLQELTVDEEMIEYTRTKSFQQYIAMAHSRSRNRSRSSNAESITEFTGTPSTRSLDSLTATRPTPITTILHITTRVENLNSAASIEAIMSGTTSGRELVNRSISNTTGDDTVIYHLLFNDWEYDDPTKAIDGVIRYTMNSFVDYEAANESYQLKFDIALRTGELVTLYRDITDQIKDETSHEIDIELLIGDEVLTLPESEEAGFNVNGWGDAIKVPL